MFTATGEVVLVLKAGIPYDPVALPESVVGMAPGRR
jgi:hypothetical protein